MTDQNSLVDEMAEAMHNANYTTGRKIPRSGYSNDYQEYLLRQADAALTIVKKHYELKGKSNV